MENLLNYHKKYVLDVYDYIPDVDKSVYDDILDETYWDLFTNPQFNTEESRMIKAFCDKQIQAIKDRIPDSQNIKDIITNTDKYKKFVDSIFIMDDDVYDEILKLYDDLVTKSYNAIKIKDKVCADLWIAMSLAFYESWLNTEYVSEQSKQREYLAKNMISKFNKDLSDSNKFPAEFVEAVDDLKKALIKQYIGNADVINRRDFICT